jgi:hypothetical protein
MHFMYFEAQACRLGEREGLETLVAPTVKSDFLILTLNYPPDECRRKFQS